MKFSELVDLVALQGLCDSFAALTNATTTLMELDGTPIAGSPWQDVCAQYHQFFPGSQVNCRLSDDSLCSRLAAGEHRSAHRCRNGLWDVAVPDRGRWPAGGEPLRGPVLHLAPGPGVLCPAGGRVRVQSGGLPRHPGEGSIIQPEQIPPMIEFFAGLARLIGELGLTKHRLEETNHALAAEKERMGESESLLRAITDAIPDPIFLKGRDGRLQFVNQAYLKAVGKPAGQVLGRMDSESTPTWRWAKP